MPLGCLVGVVLGFWHDKLIADYRNNLATAKRFLSACHLRLVTWKNGVVNYTKRPMEHIRRLWAKTPKDWGFARRLIQGLVWFVSLPLLFVEWLRKHPVNRANTITALMTPAIILVMWKFDIIFPEKSGGVLDEGPLWFQLVMIGTLIGCAMLPFAPAILLVSRSADDMEVFYQQYSRYRRYGAIGWVVYELKNIAIFFLYAFLAMEAVLFAVAMFGILTLATIAIVFCAVIPARVFWRCVQLPGHWFCFGVTVLTTLASWLGFRDYIMNPAFAWMLALGNGIVAAVVTEVLRRTYAWMVSHWVWLHELTHFGGEEPDATLGFLNRKLCKPFFALLVLAWQKVKPYLPTARLSRDSFWLPA